MAHSILSSIIYFLVLQSRERIQSTLDDDRLLIVEQPSKPWDIFSNYYPTFKIISRVRNVTF